jgi:hypothetical protein
VTILAGAPGTLEIDAYITKNNRCDEQVSRSVPIVCPPAPAREMYLNGPEVISGDSFGAWLDYDPAETIRWEVTGGTIKQIDVAGVSIFAGAPGLMVIDAYISKNGACEYKISRTVPVVCYVDPDRAISTSVNTVAPGGLVQGFVNVFPWFNETLRWEVRGGTIQSTDGLNIYVVAGAEGTLEIDAFITHGGCEFKVSRSIPIACVPDPTIGLFFDKGGVQVGETLRAWTFLREGQTAQWTIINGTPASATGDSVDIVAGGTSGPVEINLSVSDGYCTTTRRAFIFVYR